MPDINVKLLNDFFECDRFVKDKIISCAPKSNDDYPNIASIVAYKKELRKSLKDIFSSLKKEISGLFSDNFFKSKIDELEKKIGKEYNKCNHNLDAFREFYYKCICNMEPKFVEDVKSCCVGYTGHQIDGEIEVNTINEMLHLMHSYIINNEQILGSVPIIDEKINNYGYPIRLRGKSNPIFHQMFMNFPSNIDVGWTDMVIVDDNKLVMMVRDRGHALTMEITVNNNIARIDYFIPKITNMDMVTSLPGIKKITNPDTGATGIFETSIDSLPDALYTFISRVPMDMDSPIYGSNSR